MTVAPGLLAILRRVVNQSPPNGEEWSSLQGSFSAGIHPLQVATVDSRSMRRVNENNASIVLAIAADANSGGILMQTAGRVLVSHGQR